jgi:hypothetical protein
MGVVRAEIDGAVRFQVPRFLRPWRGLPPDPNEYRMVTVHRHRSRRRNELNNEQMYITKDPVIYNMNQCVLFFWFIWFKTIDLCDGGVRSNALGGRTSLGARIRSKFDLLKACRGWSPSWKKRDRQEMRRADPRSKDRLVDVIKATRAFTCPPLPDRAAQHS